MQFIENLYTNNGSNCLNNSIMRDGKKNTKQFMLDYNSNMVHNILNRCLQEILKNRQNYNKTIRYQ